MRIKLNLPFTAKEISAATGALYQGDKDKTFSYIVTNSDEAIENDLFIALRGTRTDANDFVKELRSRGVYCLCETCADECFLVSDTEEAMLKLSRAYKNKLASLRYTVGITGSVGKTTTKEYLAILLSQHYRVHKTPKNYNSELGLALSIFSAPADTEILVLEMGMNHPGEIEKLSRAAEPDLAIITNVGHAHIGNLGTINEIAKEKMSIVNGRPQMPVLVPEREPLLDELANKITVGETDADITIKPLSKSESGTRLFYQNGTRTFSFDTPITDADLLHCFSLSFAAGARLGLSEDELKRGALLSMQFPGRRRHEIVREITLIDDTYNASPESMEAALRALAALPCKRRIAVLGDMLELGAFTEPLHRKLGEELARLCFDRMFLFGVYTRYIKEAAVRQGYAEKNIFITSDTSSIEPITSALSSYVRAGDAVLFKASNGVRLWRVKEKLKEALHND